MKLRFDTACDEGRIEEGEPIDPLDGHVVGIFQKETRPRFHLHEDGSVTLVAKTGSKIFGFGRNGEVVEE